MCLWLKVLGLNVAESLLFVVNWGYRCCLLLLVLVIAGCSGQSSVRDSGPASPVDVSHVRDAVPRAELITRAGNPNPYSVLGKTYHLVEDNRGFEQRGYASWYGRKFHGANTSNGEVYDMYGMTAAHKTLRIPCYVRVTNLDNGRQVVVRVNDRGPFHGERIIDLTYTAATKLGFVDRGTAPVHIEVIEPPAGKSVERVAGPKVEASIAVVDDASPVEGVAAAAAVGKPNSSPRNPPNTPPGAPPSTYLQVGAFGAEPSALALQQRIAAITEHPVRVVDGDKFYRVRIGPLSDERQLQALRQLLQQRQLAESHIVRE